MQLYYLFLRSSALEDALYWFLQSRFTTEAVDLPLWLTFCGKNFFLTYSIHSIVSRPIDQDNIIFRMIRPIAHNVGVQHMMHVNTVSCTSTLSKVTTFT